jgi:hypothetical protein
MLFLQFAQGNLPSGFEGHILLRQNGVSRASPAPAYITIDSMGKFQMEF